MQAQRTLRSLTGAFKVDGSLPETVFAVNLKAGAAKAPRLAANRDERRF